MQVYSQNILDVLKDAFKECHSNGVIARIFVDKNPEAGKSLPGSVSSVFNRREAALPGPGTLVPLIMLITTQATRNQVLLKSHAP